MSVSLPTSSNHGEPAKDGGTRQRFVGGIDVRLHPAEVRGVILKLTGRGLDARPNLHAVAVEDISRGTASLLEDVVLDGQARPARMAQLATELSEMEAVVVQRLLNQHSGGRTSLLGFGVHDPGVWTIDPMARSSYMGLCDAARLAETSGVNVIDDFPARDIAQRGYGRPLEAMPYWFLLGAERDVSTLVVDIAARTTLTWLPPRLPADVGYAQLAAEALPGFSLIEKLERAAVRRLGAAFRGLDALDDLSIDDELLQRWLADSQRKVRLHWRPEDDETGWLLDQVAPAALADVASSRRVIRTARTFLVQSIAERAEQFYGAASGDRRILMSRGAMELAKPLKDSLPAWRATPISAGGIEEDWLPASTTAMLALLHLDQIPANLPELTGASAPRVLGRLTPGSPGAWRRLLLDMTSANPSTLALRRAV
jgi:anhydro-N-acetylmuramic acid kinase